MKTKYSLNRISLMLLLLAVSTKGYAQYLPLTGGVLSGVAVGPNFIETGSRIDLAPSGIFMTDGVNTSGGAVNRSFNSYTRLTPGQYLTVDIGSDLINVAVISFGTYFSSDPKYIPSAFNVDYSYDNATWVNLATVTNNTNLYPSYRPNLAARYWRVTVNATPPGSDHVNISGLQIISTLIGAVANNYWNSPFNGKSIFTSTPVSIGTKSIPSSYMLAVNGSVLATSMTVKLYTNWPDYVFKKDYHLPTLTEIKNYIDQNQRLPDMPSAQEVRANGIDLGEMNRLLIKKVEELTLYLIEKDKEIKALKQDQRQQIQELKKGQDIRITALEEKLLNIPEK